MVSVNCTAVPGPLLESEFFGHERGAFTGADRTKQGLVELAGDGSLFLDEIGDLDLGLQGKLLRLIEERRFKRIGGNHEIRANVRFIAATNRDLRAMVAADRFREDLLYRLDVYQIQLPPLRERDGDVPLLARHFIQQFNVQMKKEVEDLGEDAAAALVRYDFPGNVRQLRNLVEQAMITAHGRWLTLDRFQGLQLSGHESVTRSGRDAGAGAGLQHEPAGAAADGPLDQQLAAVRATEQELWEREVAIIQEALARSDGKKSQAAELLGISRFALQRRLRRMNDHSG
jgi:two-component system response regulator AtoC